MSRAGLARSAEVTLILVLHGPGQPGAAIFISVLPAVLCLAWFI